jgi:hypothetical protein
MGLFFGLAQGGIETIDTSIYSTPGTYNWNRPSSTSSIQVECYGGGGAGAGSTTNEALKAGGAGGAYAKVNYVFTSSAQTGLTILVPEGVRGTTGNATALALTDVTTNGDIVLICRAVGGQSASDNTAGVGSSTGCVGDIVRKGGAGAVGLSSGYSGAGGGGAGSTMDGSAGFSSDLETWGGAGGGGAAGIGGAGIINLGNSSGLSGSQAGGGGSGAFRLSAPSQTGGSGGNGYVKLIWTSEV